MCIYEQMHYSLTSFQVCPSLSFLPAASVSVFYFPLHCQRAYITVAQPSQTTAEKTLGRCLESIAYKFIHVCVYKSRLLCVAPLHSSKGTFAQDPFDSRCFTLEFAYCTAEAPEEKYINTSI